MRATAPGSCGGVISTIGTSGLASRAVAPVRSSPSTTSPAYSQATLAANDRGPAACASRITSTSLGHWPPFSALACEKPGSRPSVPRNWRAVTGRPSHQITSFLPGTWCAVTV
jgi:hypothetical protein